MSNVIKKSSINVKLVNLGIIVKQINIDIIVKEQISFKELLFLCVLNKTISKYLIKL